MAIKFLSDIDNTQNETKQFVIEDLATAPLNPIRGQFYFNTTDQTSYWFNGTDWVNLNGMSFREVQELPQEGEEGIIYLVPNSDPNADYRYDKFFYYDDDWEPLGSGSNIDVIDNLTSTRTDAALSAKQGKVLNEAKISSTDDTVDDIITLTLSEYNALRTNNQLQEKTLYNIIDDASSSGGVTVEDNLTSTSTINALSANQGRVLKGLVDGKADISDIPSLTNYVQFTDKPTTTKSGPIIVGYGCNVDTYGTLYANNLNYTNYTSANDNVFISKGTLKAFINKEIILKGTITPTTSTVGYRVGQLYLNTTDNTVYQLTAIDSGNSTYTWQQLITKPNLDTTLQDYVKPKTISLDDYYTYFDRDEITSYISYSDFNKIYNFEYPLIYFYTNERVSGKLIINRIMVTSVKVQPSLDYSEIRIINITLSDGTFVDISADVNTSKVYKGTTGPNQGGLACFVGNTLVNTDQGLKFISQIKEGDKVLSYNFDKQKTEYKKVNNVYSHYTNLLYKLQTDEDIITCTYDEPLYTIPNCKVQAQFISPGTRLFTTDEEHKTVVQNVQVLRNIEPRVLVYDLSVEGNYNYFVTENNILAITEDITKKED